MAITTYASLFKNAWRIAFHLLNLSEYSYDAIQSVQSNKAFWN